MIYHHIHMKSDGLHTTIHCVVGEGSVKKHDVYTINPRGRDAWELRNHKGEVLNTSRRVIRQRAIELALGKIRRMA